MKKILILCFILLLIFTPIIVHSEIISHTVTFDESALHFARQLQYDVITLENLGVSADIGKPQLPVEVAHLLLPPNSEIVNIEIKEVKKKFLRENYLIFPVQKPEPISSPVDRNKHIAFTEPDPSVYISQAYYPVNLVELKDVGDFGNNRLASFFIHPLQYNPATQKVIFYSEIKFNIHVVESGFSDQKLKNGTTSYISAFSEFAEKFVLNAPQEDTFTPSSLFSGSQDTSSKYVIITKDSYVDEFQELADWKIKKGVRAKIMSVEKIYTAFEGVDHAEKVRNFIKYARDNWGTIWILLGGDIDIVPHRRAYAMDCKYTSYDPYANDIPCDLYFSDLDGNWDSNRNGIYGEIADDIDMYPDVYVGRASVETSLEVLRFVKKILAYEKAPGLNYLRNMLFAADILWENPYTDNGIAKDMIEAEFSLNEHYNIEKLYASNGTLSLFSVLNNLNKGMHIFNHNGHAYTRGMAVGSGSFDVTAAMNLTNGTESEYFICFSIGCYPGNFEESCVGEAVLNNPNGGGVAFIGNSRFGWGSPGNPGYGYSERYDSKFFKYLFQDKNINIGLAVAFAKMFHIPYAQEENVHRWCMYELNLLGDPEMPVWTDVPKTLSVIHPDTLTMGNSTVHVTVLADGVPVSQARVCLMQKDGAYVFGQTRSNGEINFPITIDRAVPELDVTVTAPNYLPYEGKIGIKPEHAYIATTKYVVNDDTGNNDGLLNPAESGCLNITLKNYGNETAENVAATISTNNTFITITDSTIYAGNISPYDSVSFVNAFSFSANAECENGQVVPIELEIEDDKGNTWKQMLSLTIASPELISEICITDEIGGNGDGSPEAGETIQVIMTVKNEGLAPAFNVNSSSLISDDSYLTISPEPGSFGTCIEHGSTGIDSFTISIDPSCPTPRIAMLNAELTVDGSLIFPVSFELPIGQFGFFDDIENGEGNWIKSAKESSLWHISSIRYHSPNHSWYCGREADTTYTNNNLSELYSPYFNIGPDAMLSFWLWFDVAIYSMNNYVGDGMYVKLDDGSEDHTLDFLGTGGALNPFLMQSGWCQYTYDLSAYAPCANARIKFEFVSDPFWYAHPEPHQGIFLDDVKINYSLTIGVEDEHKMTTIPATHKLKSNYPNPFNQSTIFEYSITGLKLQHVELEIYNILGQKIKTLVNKKQSGGNYIIQWNGCDDSGQAVASGIYVYQLRVADYREDKKLVILR